MKNPVTVIVAFILGGLFTFFATDYIQLKTHQPKTPAKSRYHSNFKKSISDIDRVHDQIQQNISKAFGNPFFSNYTFDTSDLNGLKVEEYEDDGFKYVEVNAEGIDKDSLNINISEGMISISGEIRKTEDNQASNSNLFSTFVSSFNRSFNIPHGVREENVKIDTKDNKIVIKFPKERV